MMRSIINKASSHIIKPFSLINRTNYFKFTTANNIQFDDLSKSFLQHKDMVVFSELIRLSNNTVDNINYFRIFKLLQDTKSELKHYEDFFMQVNSTVNKKSDNVRMLLAKVKTRIAKKQETNQSYYDALRHLELAMQILEQSLVPPILLYYQIYRYYGLIHYRLGNKKQAIEALTEAVTTIKKCIEHSDDYVSTNDNTISQAKGFTVLAEIDMQNEQKWINLAFQSWNEYEGDKYTLQDYGQSIIVKGKIQLKKDREKAEQFLTANIFQFKDNVLKQKLKKKKQQLVKQG